MSLGTVRPPVYSLNVPVPASVAALAGDLARDLPRAEPRARGTHTLVAKRLGGSDRAGDARLESRAREAVRGLAPFEVRVDGVGQFERAASGPSPVVYLAVDSAPLERLHDRLCERFAPVADVEGDDYTPHVTVARGGDPAAAARLVETDVEPVCWTVDELRFYDAGRESWTSRLSLPA